MYISFKYVAVYEMVSSAKFLIKLLNEMPVLSESIGQTYTILITTNPNNEKVHCSIPYIGKSEICGPNLPRKGIERYLSNTS